MGYIRVSSQIVNYLLRLAGDTAVGGRNVTLTTKKIAILTIVVLVLAAAVVVANPITMPFMYRQETHNHKECEHGKKYEKNCFYEYENECN